jgi:tRNA 5-methylaminomethyl-2-thiouridine biosynthesis bifunctional protein
LGPDYSVVFAMSRLPPRADLDWSADGAPRARAYDDVYFSTRGGLAESEAVFLAGCDLPNAWAGRSRFAICELGFGTGLNVLAAWRAWRSARKAHAILHIVSIEAQPLTREDATRALGEFPELASLAKRLLAQWPVRAYAPQRLWFPDDGFALTLLHGDAEACLASLTGNFDAFFLDGFSPSRNAAMWSETVLHHVARLAAPRARVATFSVAGAVRRGLEAAGFDVEKKPGFGSKRERLEATRRDTPQQPSFPLYPYAAAKPRRVAILGAGIAGAACAHALARRGVETILLDAALQLGAGASGNPAGLVMPRLDRSGALSTLFLAAYIDAVSAYAALGEDVFTLCGVEERAEPRRAAAFADLLNDPPLPEDWFTRAANDAALHVRAGVVRPLEAIKAWTANAQVILESPVAALERAGDGWLLRAPDGRALLKADAVVLACGAALGRFEAASFLPLHLSRGQIEWGAIDGAPPGHALVSGSYAAPFEDGIVFGSTFDRVDGPPAPSPAHDIAGEAPAVLEARARNIAALEKLAPDLAARIHHERLRSRAAIRVGAPDFAPIAGLLPDAPAWLAQNAGLAHGRAPDAALPAPALENLYVLGGLGARGLTLAPILGERIAAEMFGEPQSLPANVLGAIHPARFLHRALKRGS